jgi:cytochrome c5
MKFKCINCFEEYDEEPEDNYCNVCHEDAVYSADYVDSNLDWEDRY